MLAEKRLRGDEACKKTEVAQKRTKKALKIELGRPISKSAPELSAVSDPLSGS
jgi:hypothetical protein